MAVTAEQLRAGIGERLREGRKACSLTQAELAVMTGMSRPSVVNIEAGRQETTATQLSVLAAAVGLTVGQLVGESPMPAGYFRPGLAETLRAAIAAADTTQAALALHVGISAKHMSQLLQGKAWPAPELVDRLLFAVGRRIVVDTEPLTTNPRG